MNQTFMSSHQTFKEAKMSYLYKLRSHILEHTVSMSRADSVHVVRGCLRLHTRVYCPPDKFFNFFNLRDLHLKKEGRDLKEEICILALKQKRTYPGYELFPPKNLLLAESL